MQTTTIVVLLLMGLALAWYSYVVWFNPKALLKWSRNFRSQWYRTPGGSLSKRMYGRHLDEDPQLELWLARLGVLALYGLAIYIISLYIRASR